MKPSNLRKRIEEIVDKTGRYYMAYGSGYRADKGDEEIVSQLLALFSQAIEEVIGEIDEKLSGGIIPEGSMVMPGEHRMWYANDGIKRVIQEARRRMGEMAK